MNIDFDAVEKLQNSDALIGKYTFIILECIFIPKIKYVPGEFLF